MSIELKFKEDGSFKIVQFTDVHWADGSEKDINTSKLMEKILLEEKPDLVVFTGDLVCSDKNVELLNRALEPVNNLGIPWASVFGNHDVEFASNKEELLKIKQKSKFCLTEAGPSDISGLGNYKLAIKASKNSAPSWNLYFFDSGAYNLNEKVKGYDFIKRNQIEWYTKLSQNVKNEYGKVPALSFFHIPLPEYKEVWEHHTCYGSKNEECCCSNQNSGLFSAMLEMGEVKGVFVGHDHVNDYYGDLYGIKLCYGRATGYNTYVKEGFLHGARVIELKEGQEEFKTWVTLEDGSKILNPEIHTN